MSFTKTEEEKTGKETSHESNNEGHETRCRGRTGAQ